MNGLVAPKPALDALSRWTRNAELLVYLVPVGTISAELYEGYTQLLHEHSVLPIASLTRPGGYMAELSPFRSFAWDGSGQIRFRFVSTADKIESFDGEDVHACYRPIGVLGICHCPSTLSLPAAYQQFMDSIRHFPGMLVQKCFAFEHQFDVSSVDECAALQHLVMFPADHALDSGGSTVSLHLQVVLDTISVTILMSLESTIRAAIRQQQTQTPLMPDLGDTASVLLDTNIEPAQMQQHGSSVALLSRDAASPFPQDKPSSSASSSGGGVASMLFSSESRGRKRQLARQKKLFGDYSLLVSCVTDALEHYVTAIELLREEERKSAGGGGGGVGGDALWLAAALEGYIYCLCHDAKDKFLVEIVEKTSEAVALYAKAGVSDLESLLIEHVGWYYTRVAVQLGLSTVKGLEKVEESIWMKRLLWDLIERGLALFPELQPSRQLQFLVQSARMLEAVGHHRRMSFLLHEAVSLIVQRTRATGVTVSSPSSSTLHSQRLRDLRAALRLEQLTAARLGMENNSTGRRRGRRRPRKGTKVTIAMTMREVAPWLALRFHVLRQLLAVTKLLAEPVLIGQTCIQLLQTLAWCADELASKNETSAQRSYTSVQQLDQPQQPFSSQRVVGTTAAALHAKHSVYFSPPASIETKTKRYFSLANSPSAMSSAAATLSSTIASTPRLLSTPRQQLSAAVNAISTKAAPSFGSFSHGYPNGGSPAWSSSSSASSPAITTSSAVTSRGSLGDASAVTSSRESSFESEANGVQPSSSSAASTALEDVRVWDLRSREEIHRLERRVLSILEAECLVLRPSEQLKLESFVLVDKMRVRRSWGAPHLTRERALRRCGVSSEVGNGEDTTSKPAFFYNPFDKQKNNAKTENADDSEDEDNEPQRREYERTFPVYEELNVDVALSNPLGIELELQQITAWITFEDESGATSSAGVETYPITTVLHAYERLRRVRLGLRPLQPGKFFVRGCFIKVLNVKTSFALETPLLLDVRSALPLVSLSLMEIGSLSMTQEPEKPSPSTSSPSQDGHARICMFTSEKKRCVLHVRNTGQRPIHQLHVGVRIRRSRAAPSSAPTTAILSRLHDTALPVVDSVESDGVVFRSLADKEMVGSLLPLERGDRLALPFEVELRTRSGQRHHPNADQKPQEHDEVLECELFYADNLGESFFREAKLVVQLVSLPSLSLGAVQILPSAPLACVSRDDALMDNSHCLVLVDVVNPTETVFLLSIRERHDTMENANWDMEIGRQSTRRVMLVIPREEMEDSQTLDEALNARVDIRWGTYFGTHGHLLFDASVVGSSIRSLQQQLTPSAITFGFEGLRGLVEQARGDESREDIGLTFPWRFVVASERLSREASVSASTFRARLFEACALVVHVMLPLMQSDDDTIEVRVIVQRDGAEVEAVEDDDSSIDESVLASGVLSKTLTKRDSGDQVLPLECLFLSEGRFVVMAYARRLVGGREDPDEKQEPVVWSHRPMRIRVESD
ncbi:hypothetical protein Poli38472_001555 [Pythium oligandrum]|uniref:Trs120/TRAPPC9 N-terminal domain-containing protein n=1 Tax=Pythium oligandrum TaxID=41045 RepID=A0A8K1CTS0_PYTOL|nr:hypothetical protein Poli38472_001555 [Pythium oligandrum]|eukprot:TMW69399.1 hypothetical protein Poli38472_001555 [Pythium oligandrum]